MTKIMLVRSTGLNQRMIDEVISTHRGVDYVVVEDSKGAIYDKVKGVSGLIGCPRPLMKAELIREASPTLRWIHSTGAGCESFFFKELVESHIVLTNGKIIQGPEVADHALALLLSLTRNLCYYISGNKPDTLPRPVELRGKTAAVIGGGGGIGLLIAERVSAFGMDVIVIDTEYVHMTSFIRQQADASRLMEILPIADVVFMAAPETYLSHNLFNHTTFNAMKKGAFFVNISRGPTVVTDDLLAALREGKLAGAGLDVTNPEPLPEDHPLRFMSNVVLTPHVAGPSDWNRQRSFDLILKNIGRFISDTPLLNVVDKRRQY
jgi:D-2-hydroxyacid dehydrogenase (NADP+)